MKLLWLTFGFGVLSAAVPVFNMEVFIGGVAARAHNYDPLLLAFVGSFAQNIGKLPWYYAAKGVLHVPWMERKLEDPKRKASYERWSQRVQGRPWLNAAAAFVSGLGFPPFFVMAAVAGALRMNVVVFFVAGLLGRTIFFWMLLLGFGLAFH